MYYRIISRLETPALEFLKALSFPDIATAVEYMDSLDLNGAETGSIQIIGIN